MPERADHDGWPAALAQLDQALRAEELLAVLRGATRDGLLVQLTRPTTVEGLRTELEAPPARIGAVLQLLAAHRIVTQDDGAWQLTGPWSALVQGGAPLVFDAYLGMGRVRAQQFEVALSGGDDYQGLDAADRLLVARGIAFEPTVDGAVAMARGDLGQMNGLVDALDAGGRLLELGCGIGSRLSAVLRAFPKASAVGVELDPELVAFGRARAADLDLADRLTYVAGDAVDYEPDGVFDFVGWSQFFFPAPSRPGALATARRALRPGGWISMPVTWSGEELEPGTGEAHEAAADALMLDLWQVPRLTAYEVRDEVAAAGFVDVRIDERPMVHFVRGRQPG